MQSRFKYILSWITWPALFAVCMALTAYGFMIGRQVLFFNFAYIFLMIALFLLEKYMPHEKEWIKPDGQTFQSIAHSVSSKGTAQLLIIYSTAIGLSEYLKPLDEAGHGIWPVTWPMWAQVCLGVVVAEFGLYWAHRFSHETPPLWRFHAIHHSVKKLWFVNTGRFHFMDSLWKILFGMACLIAAGAPMEVVQWLSAVTAFVGLMTHCNVEMRFGPLNYIFSTPELHRWHHSKDLREGDKNYGENVIIWDLLFGTWFNEPRRPPADIGIPEYMPPGFMHQLAWPFLSEKMRKRLDVQHYTYEPQPKQKEIRRLFFFFEY